MKNKELNFLDYFAVLVKWRKLIVINCATISLIAIVVSLALPKWYTARSTILPPVEQPSGAFGLASVLSELPIGELGVPGISSPFEIFKAILESQTVSKAVVIEFDLMKVYKKKNMENAVQALGDHTRIEVTDEGLISISVEDRSPELAADIANSFIKELDRVNQQKSISRAKSTRIFIERRLAETKNDLQRAEEALRRFQEENKTVSLPDQTTAAIQSAAELRAKQVLLEVERGVLLKTMSSAHPQVIRLQFQIEEIQKQLDRITIGIPEEPLGIKADQSNMEESFNIPLLEVPSVGLRLARLIREVKMQEAIFELLTEQYEQAKIQEAKDTPTVQVLDEATPPVRKSRPKRMIFVLLWFLISLVLGVICAFLLEYWQKIKLENGGEYEKIRRMAVELKGDIPFRKE